MAEWLPAWVRGRVARPHKLYSFQMDPCLVRGPVEPTMFHYLTQEGDDSLGACSERGS